MDGPTGSRGKHPAGPRKEVVSSENSSNQERHDIFVRAHTRVRTRIGRDRRWSAKWPRYCLIFDTETTLDPAQKLNFGIYRRCVLVDEEYLCLQEGIFYRDDLRGSRLKWLDRYRRNPKTLASIETFPAATNLRLMTRSDFISRV